MDMPTLIPSVFVVDLGWLLLVILAREYVIQRYPKAKVGAFLLKAMVFYVTLELWFHGPMEEVAAVVFAR